MSSRQYKVLSWSVVWYLILFLKFIEKKNVWKTLNGTDRHTDGQTDSDESGRGLRNHNQDCPLLTVRRPQRILYRAVTNIMLYLEAKHSLWRQRKCERVKYCIWNKFLFKIIYTDHDTYRPRERIWEWFFPELCKLLGIEKTRTTPCRPHDFHISCK